MVNHRLCHRCGGPLTELAAGHLCTACLLRGGLGAEGIGHQPDAGDPGLTPDLPAGLSAPFPRTFGDYELLEVVARGGMGIVFRAHQRSLHRTVAIKMLLAGELAEPKFIERFRAEAEMVAQLQHPNIVAIHEIGEHEHQPFYSMDFVEGKNLAEVISDLRFHISDFKRSATWMEILAEAVHYAHQRGIIHRDLKPSNVLIDILDQPRITDFGVAKRWSESPASIGHSATMDLTLSGQILGSPNYLPPEQAEGRHGAVGPPSDVYSLGAILYQLLTGRPPFQADSLATLLKQVIEAQPVAPRVLNPGVPRDLETICLKCLEKEIPRRYPTAQALAEDLARFLDGRPVQARPLHAPGRLIRWTRRKPVGAALSAALILTFLAGLMGTVWQLNRARAGESLALKHAYAGDIKEAQRALEDGDLGGARRILEKHRPAKPTPGAGHHPAARADLRGWEWRYLWGQCGGDEQSKLIQQPEGLVNLAISPDGNRIAVRHQGGNLDVLDAVEGRRLGVLTNDGRSAAMAFVPGSQLFASGNRSNQKPLISFWDLTRSQIVRTLPHPTPVSALAVSMDGNWLATVDVEPRLRLWNMASGELLHEIRGLGAMNNLGRVPLFSPDGTTLAFGEMDGSIRLLDRESGRIRITIPAPTRGNGVMALAFSPDNRLLAAGYGLSDGTIRLWDTSTGAPAGVLEGHRSWVSRLLFAPDGKRLYSASADQTLRVWDPVQTVELRRLQGHTQAVTGLALDRDGTKLVSCSLDGTVRIWDLQQKRPRLAHTVLPVQVAPYGAPFTRDSRRLITASPNHPVTIWEVATARELKRLPALGTNHLSVALSPDERLLAVGSLDGTIRVWDLTADRLAKEFRPQSLPIRGLRFWDGGQTLMSYAMVWNQRIAVQRWDVSSWKEVPFGPMDVTGSLVLSQSPDHGMVAIPSTAGVALWDSKRGELKAMFPTPDGAMMTAFSRDSRLLAAAFGGGARVWDVHSGHPLAAIPAQANPVISVALSPDNLRLVTGGMIGMRLQPALRVWDFSIQRELLSLQSIGEYTGWTEFSPDGNTLLGLSWSGVADLYRAPTWEEIEAEERGGNGAVKARGE